ncbi:unnamed protein product [Ilex paraguariensis]|uniref:Uncharacterized protein n=1 Tax=Ilex paraguariensis TaxID=185542 RepID=A0ABC8R5N6_9AQUA
MERGRGSRVSRGMLPLLALHAVSEYCRLDRKPPVTAGLLAANTLIYLRPSFLESILPTVDEVWFNPHLILKPLVRESRQCIFIAEFLLFFSRTKLLDFDLKQLQESVARIQIAEFPARCMLFQCKPVPDSAFCHTARPRQLEQDVMKEFK